MFIFMCVRNLILKSRIIKSILIISIIIFCNNILIANDLKDIKNNVKANYDILSGVLTILPSKGKISNKNKHDKIIIDTIDKHFSEIDQFVVIPPKTSKKLLKNQSSGNLHKYNKWSRDYINKTYTSLVIYAEFGNSGGKSSITYHIINLSRGTELANYRWKLSSMDKLKSTTEKTCKKVSRSFNIDSKYQEAIQNFRYRMKQIEKKDPYQYSEGKVAILPFVGLSKNDSEISNKSAEEIYKKMQNTGKFKIISPNLCRKLGKKTGILDDSELSDKSSIQKFKYSTNSKIIVHGSYKTKGNKTELTVSAYNVDKGQSLFSRNYSAKSKKKLDRAIEKMANEVTEIFLSKIAGENLTTNVPPPTPVVTPPVVTPPVMPDIGKKDPVTPPIVPKELKDKKQPKPKQPKPKQPKPKQPKKEIKNNNMKKSVVKKEKIDAPPPPPPPPPPPVWKDRENHPNIMGKFGMGLFVGSGSENKSLGLPLILLQYSHFPDWINHLYLKAELGFFRYSANKDIKYVNQEDVDLSVNVFPLSLLVNYELDMIPFVIVEPFVGAGAMFQNYSIKAGDYSDNDWTAYPAAIVGVSGKYEIPQVKNLWAHLDLRMFTIFDTKQTVYFPAFSIGAEYALPDIDTFYKPKTGEVEAQFPNVSVFIGALHFIGKAGDYRDAGAPTMEANIQLRLGFFFNLVADVSIGYYTFDSTQKVMHENQELKDISASVVPLSFGFNAPIGILHGLSISPGVGFGILKQTITQKTASYDGEESINQFFAYGKVMLNYSINNDLIFNVGTKVIVVDDDSNKKIGEDYERDKFVIAVNPMIGIGYSF